MSAPFSACVTIVSGVSDIFNKRISCHDQNISLCQLPPLYWAYASLCGSCIEEQIIGRTCNALLECPDCPGDANVPVAFRRRCGPAGIQSSRFLPADLY